MVVVYFNTTSFISVLPRYAISNTGTLTMFLTNESDNVRTEFPVIVASYSNVLTLNATQIASDTKSGQSFKLEILNGTDFVYLGRLINVDSSTDIQNYSRANQSTSIFS